MVCVAARKKHKARWANHTGLEILGAPMQPDSNCAKNKLALQSLRVVFLHDPSTQKPFC